MMNLSNPIQANPIQITGSAKSYNVDSISNPQASSNASGMYFEFLLRRAHSRRRVDRMYWSGVSLYSLTICSNDVTVGTTGPIGSGLPQFGFPRRFAISTRSSFPGGVIRRKHFSLARFYRKLAVSPDNATLRLSAETPPRNPLERPWAWPISDQD